MADKIQLNCEKRTLFGRKVKQLRAKGLVPANVYGSKIKSQAISIPLIDFKKIFKKAGETQIIYLQVKNEKEARPVLISNYQTHPIDRHVYHIDFRQVDLSEKVKAMIPLEFTGEPPAESTGAVVVTLKDEIEVEALPTQLPEKFTISLDSLKEVGDMLTVKDLKVDKDKVEITLSENEVLAKAEEPKKVEEEEKPAEAAEGEEGEEGEAEEGEKDEGEKKEGEDDKKGDADKKEESKGDPKDGGNKKEEKK